MEGINPEKLNWTAQNVTKGTSIAVTNLNLVISEQYDLVLSTKSIKDPLILIQISLFISSEKSWCEMTVFWGNSDVMLQNPSRAFYVCNVRKISRAYSKAGLKLPKEIWLISSQEKAQEI